MVTKGGRDETIPNYFVSRDIETSSYCIGILPKACGCHHLLLGLVFIVVSAVMVWHQALEVVVVLESYRPLAPRVSPVGNRPN